MISVIVSTYNRATFLKKCICSILNQTYNDFELIIIDDGSIDQTLGIVKNFNDLRIKYFRVNHLGNVSDVRNTGYKHSSGDVIAFCDDDDLWEPNKLEKQIYHLKNYDIITCNAKVIDVVDRLLMSKYYSDFEHDTELKTDILIKKNYVLTSCVLIRRNVLKFESILFNSEDFGSFAEDYDLWLRLSLGNKIFFQNECLASIRMHDNIHKHQDNQLIMSKNLLKIYLKYKNHEIKSIKLSSNVSSLTISYYILKEYLNRGRFEEFISQLLFTFKFFHSPKAFFLTVTNLINNRIKKLKSNTE